MAELRFAARIDNDQLRKDAEQTQNILRGVGNAAVSEGNQINNTISTLTRGIASLGLAFSAGAFIREIVQVRGEFQQLGIAFETMLGSRARAERLMAEITELALTTPYSVAEVAANTRQLIAMGIAVEDVVETMRSLGDVAAGVSVPIQRIAINYGQVAALGRLQSRELRDFALAGVPLLDELANILEITRGEVQELITAGQIGFPLVEQAFRNMSGEGGRFENLMEELVGSVTGQLNRLQDAFQLMANEIGTSGEGVIYGAIDIAATLVENYERVGRALATIITSYGLYRAALVTTIALERARNIGASVTAFFQLARTIRSAADAMALFNIASNANPLLLIASAVVAVAGAVWTFASNTEDATTALDNFNDSVDTATEKYNNLISVVRNESAAMADRQFALEELRRIYPSVFENMDIEAIKTANQTELIEAQTQAELERQRALAQARIAEINTAIGQVNPGGPQGAIARAQIRNRIKALEEERTAQEGVIEAINDTIAERERAAERARDEAAAAQQNTIRNREYWNEQKRQAQEALNSLDVSQVGSEEWVMYRQRIAEATSQLSIYSDNAKKVASDIENLRKEAERQFESYQKRITSLVEQNENERNQLIRDSLETEEERIQHDLDVRLRAIQEERQGILDLVEAYNELARSTGRQEISADLSIFDQLTENATQTANNQLNQNAQNTIRQNREYWSQYLREYGTFQERLTEITADYQNRIAEAQGKGLTGQVAILQQEMQAAIANLNAQGFSDTLFGDLSAQSSGAINAAIQQARTLIDLLRQGAGNNPQLLEVIERLENAIDNAQTNVRGRLSTGLRGIATPLRQAANLASQFNESLSNAIGYSATLVESFASISEGVENSRKAFSDFSTLMQSGTASIGDIVSGIGSIGGAIGGIIGGLTSIVSLFDGSARRAREEAEAAERRQAYQAAANRQLERYIELLDTASGAEYWNAQSNAIRNLENQLIRAEAQISKYTQGLTGIVTGLYGQSVDDLIERAQDDPTWFSNLPSGLREALETAIQIREQLDEAGYDFTQRLTQTTASDLESAIRDGLRGGMSGIDDLGQYFEDVMRDALIESFIVDQGGRKAIQQFYDRYAELAEDGLTESEMNELRGLWQTIIDNAKQAAGDIDQLLGTSAEDSRTAVAQGIATASQDSVDELNGRFTVIQSHTYQMNQTTLEMLRLMNLEMANSNAMLDHVASIHINTNQLVAIADSLTSIETRGVVIRE